MNILTNTLPTRIDMGNAIYDIVTDHKASIEFELMLEQGVTDIDKLLQPYYPKGIPKNKTEAAAVALWFYRCGDEIQKNEDKPQKEHKPTYSFAVDAEAICADFLRYYNIDLAVSSLHWWKFKALLVGLPNESAFKERIYYRTCDLKGLPPKEKKRICEIRKQIEIKTAEKGKKISLEDRNNQMRAYVLKRQKNIKEGVE